MSDPLLLFVTIATAHLLGVMSPGPDFAMVTRQTLAHGRNAGLWTAWGIAAGIIFHVSYGLFGLGWLIERLPWLLELLRYGGAGFLFYMGWGALHAQPMNESASAADRTPAARESFRIGLLTNLLNPKATMFFIALFAAVITGSTPLSLRFALGLWIVLSTGAWFSFVAFTLGQPRVREKLRRIAHWIDRVMGAILITLAVGMVGAGLQDWLS